MLTPLVAGGTKSSDFRITRLSQAIPDSEVSPLSLVDGIAADIIGHEIVAFAAGNVAGRNIVDDVVRVSNNSQTIETFAIQFDFDTPANGGSGGLGDDEIGLVGGDSSHATLIDIGGQQAIVGLNFGIDLSGGQDPANGDLYNSFSSLVVPYLDQIDAITMTDGFTASRVTVTAIPEPTYGMFAILAIAFLCRRSGASPKVSQ